ncbi:DNA repair protein RadC, partial [Listeria monocytogenes]|nr:DNA repair protein RadC [Listeria monocytogenes]
MIPIVRLSLSEAGKIHLPDYRIFGGEEAATIFQEKIGNLAREYLAIICLDIDKKALNYSEISIGKIDKVEVDYSSIFKTALLSNAKYLIVAHNHPSSDLKPSVDDINT